MFTCKLLTRTEYKAQSIDPLPVASLYIREAILLAIPVLQI